MHLVGIEQMLGLKGHFDAFSFISFKTVLNATKISLHINDSNLLILNSEHMEMKQKSLKSCMVRNHHFWAYSLAWVYLIWIQSISYQSFLEPKPYQWVLIQNTKQNLRKLFTGPLVRFQDHLNKFKSCWSQIVLPEFLLHCWLDKRHLIDLRFLWQSRKHK